MLVLAVAANHSPARDTMSSPWESWFKNRGWPLKSEYFSNNPPISRFDKQNYLFWPDIWGRLCNLQEFGPSFVVDLVLIDLWHQAIDLDDGNPRSYWTYHWIFWWNPSKYQRPLEESSQWRFQLCFHFALATILKKDNFWRKRNFRQSRKIHAFQAWN